MKKIAEDQYVSFWWDEEAKVIKSVWSENTAKFEEHDFRERLHREIEILAEYRPHGYIADTRNFYFTIAPDLQAWISENITAKYADAGVARIAFISSEEFISQLSIEQSTAPIQGEYNIPQAFFDEEKEAIAWLKTAKLEPAS